MSIKNILMFKTDGKIFNEFKSIAFYSIFVVFVLIASIFLSGQTFGQRCEKIYSDDIEVEKCIKRLVKGENA